MAQAPHEPTDQSRRLVRTLAGLGLGPVEIARVVELHYDTVKKYYADDIERGKVEANVKVATSLYLAATRRDGQGPNITACIFWLKNRAGWKDVVEQINHDANGGIDAPPIPETREEWLARRRTELAQMVAATGPTDQRH